MKRMIAILLLISVLLCGCDFQQTVNDAAEQLLRSIAENEELQKWIEEHPVEQMASDAKDTLVEKFPVLEQLLNLDNLKQILKTTGLDLLREFVSSTQPETQEKADTLGAIIKILYPDLTDEVDAVLGGIVSHTHYVNITYFQYFC